MSWRERVEQRARWREPEFCQCVTVAGLPCSRSTDCRYRLIVPPTGLSVRVTLCAWHRMALERRGAELARDRG